jgi:hypothetical protein
MKWYIFMILVSTTNPPTIFTKYEAVPIPWSWPDQASCESAKTWAIGQLAMVASPGPDTKQLLFCLPV